MKTSAALRWRVTGEALLPKGSKYVGETLKAAARHNTRQRAGSSCCLLLPNPFPTNALSSLISDRSSQDKSLTVQQRVSQGIRDIVFLYLAEIDSVTEKRGNTQDGEGLFETRWVHSDEAVPQLNPADERDILAKAVTANPFRGRS